MPELPEVSTMLAQLKICENRYIESVWISEKKLREARISNKDKLIGMQVKSLVRCGKYIIFDISNDRKILAHCGMSGRFFLGKSNNYEPKRNDHVIIKFPDMTLVYNDARRFGFFCDMSETIQNKYLNKLGVDALADSLTVRYLTEKIKCNLDIKSLLLNQKIIAGIGNIYANEILHLAKINPLKLANQLNISEVKKIVLHTKQVLKKAVTLGGSSLKDYKTPLGDLGQFQSDFTVYARKDDPCLFCKAPIIKVQQGGRATFYCSRCQK